MDLHHLTLQQLQVFVAVARSGTTAAAADLLARSQSATSAALNELERGLDLRLFDRIGKRLALNENGRALLPRALAVIDGATRIEAMSTDLVEPRLSLRVGASTTLGNYVLPAVLARYFADVVEDGPNSWHCAVRIGNTTEICRAVAELEIDIGVVEGPSHAPGVEMHPWREDEMLIVGAPGSALAQEAARAPLRIAALRRATWLLREPSSGTRETTDQLLLPRLGVYARSIELGSSEAIKHAAAAGLGIACLSRWVVADMLARGELLPLPTRLGALKRQCYWVRHPARVPTAASAAFIEMLNSAE